MKHLDYLEILDLFCWGLDKLARPTLHNLLMGYEEYPHYGNGRRVIHRMRQQQLLRQSQEGREPVYSITAKGRERLRVIHPPNRWNQKWDGAWRVVAFDIPERQRKNRKRLWRALHANKLGHLQRSVWIWPHDVTEKLSRIIQIGGFPECFCGFKATELFLCTEHEIVNIAWNWREIRHRHQHYLQCLVAESSSLHKARDLTSLAKLARIERKAYDDAFDLDPLLPRQLLPKGYAGFGVQQRHDDFRAVLKQKTTKFIVG